MNKEKTQKLATSCINALSLKQAFNVIRDLELEDKFADMASWEQVTAKSFLFSLLKRRK